MTALSMRRMAVPYIALAAACGVALLFAIQYARREPPVEAKMAATSTPAASPQSKESAALAAAEAQANAVVRGLTGSPLPAESGDGVPEFDVARVEPSGDAVIAGRTTPGATVELLRNGEVHDRAVADKSGQFVMVSPKLPPGTYDLTLRSRDSSGKQTMSRQSVAVAIEPKSTDAPVVALMTPNKPTVVLSQTDSSKATAGAVIVEAVEIEPGGKFHVSGRARAGAAVRLYLNDSFVAPVTAGSDGRFAVTINEGVAPGNYRVRVDELESNSSSVRARAEVPFNVPDQAVTGTVTAQATAPRRTDIAAVGQPQLAAAGGNVASDAASPSAVVVPKIATTTVSRGDTLWRLSQVTYGVGTRYATIYKANKQQIRNPNLIYPGQVFVMPASEARP
jgi:nucleoid-associated protein YgaU